MSDENKGVDWSASVANELKEKIEELGKKIDAIHDTHMIKYEQWADKLTAWVKDIDELKENMMTKEAHAGFNESFTEQLNELKTYYNIEKNAANGTDSDWKVGIIDRIINSEEVLQDHIKTHKHVKEKGTEIVIRGQWMDVWIEHLNRALAKLDVPKLYTEMTPTEKMIETQKFKTDSLRDGIDYEKEYSDVLTKKDSKKEECLLDKPHASAVSVERKLIEKCQCPKHKDSGDDDKELYELYLQDKDQYYFKKTTHPFTEINNMVNLGIGEMRMKREKIEFWRKELLNKTDEVLKSMREVLGIK